MTQVQINFQEPKPSTEVVHLLKHLPQRPRSRPSPRAKAPPAPAGPLGAHGGRKPSPSPAPRLPRPVWRGAAAAACSGAFSSPGSCPLVRRASRPVPSSPRPTALGSLLGCEAARPDHLLGLLGGMGQGRPPPGLRSFPAGSSGRRPGFGRAVRCPALSKLSAERSTSRLRPAMDQKGRPPADRTASRPLLLRTRGRRPKAGRGEKVAARACVHAWPRHAVREADVRTGWAGAADKMAEGGGCPERPDAETQKSELGALMRTTLQRGAQW